MLDEWKWMKSVNRPQRGITAAPAKSEWHADLCGTNNKRCLVGRQMGIDIKIAWRAVYLSITAQQALALKTQPFNAAQ